MSLELKDVADHLAPCDGVSRANVKFAGFDARGRAGLMRFDVFDGDDVVGTFKFLMTPTDKGIRGMIVSAHQQMNDALRQMLFRNEVCRKAYEGQPD